MAPLSTTLDERQRHFAAALLDPHAPIPCGLVGPNRQPDAKRFNVYRNNVVAGLVGALAASWPVTRRIVGEAFFAAMARSYARLEPPRSPVMLAYGQTFPAWIETFEAAACLPWLADVARLECAWVQAYHAAEASSADVTELGRIDPARVGRMVFALHPSVRVVRSAFPVVELWRMHVEDSVPVPIDMSQGGQNALIMRPAADVEVRCVTLGSARFIESAMAGKPVAEAAAHAFEADAAFDLPGTLIELLSNKAMTGWRESNSEAAMPRCT